MLLSKLESGFLLFQTPQGFVAVEPSSFWQRVYLLWTFRNFRQLSLPLLNARQAALINDLFRRHAPAVPREYEPWLTIGVVENFVPPLDIDAALAANSGASLAMKANLPEQVAGLNVAPPDVPIAAAPAITVDVPHSLQEETAEKESSATDVVEVARKNAPSRSSAPVFSWLRLASVPTVRLVVSRRVLVMSRFAAAIGALALGACLMAAWHRIGAEPGSQAQGSHLNSPDSPSVPAPTPVADDVPAEPEITPSTADGAEAAAPAITTPDLDGPEAASEPAPENAPSSTATTHPMITPERGSPRASARVASRSKGGPHAAASSRASASTSTHWQVDGNRAAARARLERARRAIKRKKRSSSVGNQHAPNETVRRQQVAANGPKYPGLE